MTELLIIPLVSYLIHFYCNDAEVILLDTCK